MTQTERDLKAELDSLDSYEPAPTEWPQSAPENSAVKALGVEDTIAQEVEQTRQGVKQEAEKSFLSNFFDNVVSTVRDYRGPLADDFEKNMPGGLPILGGLEGLDRISGATTGVAPSEAITGTVDEFSKTRNRDYYNTMSSFASGVEQYGKSLGSPTLEGAARGAKEFTQAKADKPFLKPRIENLADISKEKWFSDTVDYVLAASGSGIASSGPFFAAGLAGGVPGMLAFGYTTSVGELRQELIDNGVTDEATVEKYAYIAAVPHAMLDQLTERGVLKGLTAEARKEATKGIARLVLKGAGKGAVKEGVTEAAQRVIELGAVAHAKGGEAPNEAMVAAIFADVEKGVESTILESGVKGAIPGTVFGLGEVAGQQMQPVQEARVRTPNTATDATPVAPADTRAVAPMMDGPAQKGMPGATSEPATFSEPELEAARKAIQDAAQGLPVETAPEAQPATEQPQAATVEPETAPLTQEDADAIVQEADQVIADAITDEDLDLPAVFAEIEDYLAENEIQVDDIADTAVREIAQAVYQGEDLGVAVDRALGLEDAAPAVDPDRQRRLDARAAATDSAPLDATQIQSDFRDRAKAKFEGMPERDRDTSGETPEQARARRLENRAGATGSRTIQDPAAVRQKFAEVLASTTPRSQWAEASGVDPETLNTLIEEAVADGRMEIRFGKPVRKAAARVAPVKPQRPVTRTMSRAEEMRVDAIKNSTARTYAQRLLEATDAAEVEAAITAMQRNKKVSKAVLKEVVRAYGGVRGAPSSTRAAYTMIRNIAASRAPAEQPQAQATAPAAAPAPAPTQQTAPAPAPEPQERRISIITPDGSMEMTGTVEIVELDSLKAATGAMQPRDRSRKESDNQKRNIAANLDPQQLLPSRVSDTGAPLAAADGTVISGNGRVGALDIVYTDPTLADKAAAYRQAIGAPAGMKKPVMVVRMSPRATPEELTRFADLSNRSRIASLSATERAMRDARAAGMDIMGLYTGGSFTSVENREFFRAFTQLIPPNELNAFSKNGVLTKEGDDRLSASVLAAAYGDPDMLSRMLEDADDDIRSITGAMRDAAGAFIRLKAAIRNGQASIKFDITPQVAEVAKRIADLRARNIKPRAFLDQQDAFNQIDPIVESLLVAFYNDNLSRQLRREKITEILVRYADEAAKHNEGGLFEDTTTPREIVTTARTRALEGERLAATQQDFFAPSPSPAGRSDAGTSGTGSGQAPDGRGANADRQAAGAGDVDAPSRNANLERDWRDGPPQDGLGQADVPAAAGADVTGTEPGREAAVAEGQTDRGIGVPDGDAASMGGGRDSAVQGGTPGDGLRPAGRGKRAGSGDAGITGVPAGRLSTEAVGKAAANAANLAREIEAQRVADATVPFIANDADNIRAALPMLRPAGREDVIKAEARFSQPNGNGFLFTNGTGTGKTFVGLGVAKRFIAQGKTNILIVAPSQGILDGWISAGKMLNVEVTRLDDTKTAGTGVVATTYANLRENAALADRDWDLIIPDEAHHLSQNQSGSPSDALVAFRGLSGYSPASRANVKLRPLTDEIARLKSAKKALDTDQFDGEIDRLTQEYGTRHRELTEFYKTKPRAKALFLSATPFAYRKNTDWAEGFLFDYPEEKSGYNNRGGQSEFLVTNFGYKMRYGRAEEPGPEVNTGVMEREFYERLKREGVLSGRRLEVEADYDRRFVLVDDAIGAKIDQALEWLRTEGNGRYRPLADAFMKRFDYLSQRRLLEAIKAKHVIGRIQRDLELGRKVVVFHDYNEGGGSNPFAMPDNPNERGYSRYGEPEQPSLGELYNDFIRANPYVKKLNFSQFRSPIETLTEAFPQAMVYNGTIPNKKRAAARDAFNKDGSGKDIIIVQSAAGEAGISLHDTTGQHQRVLYNLGLPTRPTTAIQQEGRIYRDGQVSDAILRYMSTGTSWERRAFAQTIAERASTAENLALGDEARALRDAFIDAFNEADEIQQGPEEGKGGKSRDRTMGGTVSAYERAKAFYFAQGKVSGRRDQREGKDYFATPEPIGLKMVEFADVRNGERVLEPSAGHGAIARWFPEGADRVLIEPSESLASRAGLAAPGAKIITSRFEDHYIGNKYDAIVMNPPFGMGGKDAYDHIQKAVGHLREGGRIVAIVPRGPAADKRLEAFRDDDANKNIYTAMEIEMPGVMFERAGTSVATRILVLEKHADPETAPNPLYRDLSSTETITELFDRMEDLSLAERSRGERRPAVRAAAPQPAPVVPPVAATPPAPPVSPAPDVAAQLAQARAEYDKLNFRDMKLSEVMATPEAQRVAALEEQVRTAAVAPPPVAAPTPPPPAATTKPGKVPGTQFKFAEVKHGKTGADLFVASIAQFVQRPFYEQLRDIAKTHNGYYSTFKGRGAVPGFQFPSEADRTAFLQEVLGAPEQKAPAAAPTVEPQEEAKPQEPVFSTEFGPPKDKPVVLTFGGAFNPIHEGHVGAILDAIKMMENAGYTVQKAIVVPTPQKRIAAKHGGRGFPLAERVEMARVAFAKYPQVEVDGTPSEETNESGKKISRTALADIAQARYPGASVVNLAGEDTAVGEPPSIPSVYAGTKGTPFENYYYLVVARTEESISSSKVRDMIVAGEAIPEDVVSKPVQTYISDLYTRRPELLPKGAAGGIDPEVYPTAPNFGMPETPRTIPDDDPILVSRADDTSPEREALRQRLIDQRFKGKQPATGKPVVYVMGGGPAAGKGTLVQMLRDEGAITDNFVDLDPDSFKTGDKARGYEGLPEYAEIIARGDGRAAEVVHLESSRLLKAASARATEGKYNIVLDVTLGVPKAGIRVLNDLRKAGYEVRLFGVTVGIETALRRAYVRSQGEQRRVVAPQAMLKSHKGFAQGFAEYAKIADEAYLVDTNVVSGSMPILVASKAKGADLDINDQSAYNSFVRKGNVNENATTIGELRASQGEPESPRSNRVRLGSVLSRNDPQEVGERTGSAGLRPSAERSGGAPSVQPSGRVDETGPVTPALSVSDFAKSVADLKAKVSKEQPRSKLIQDDVVDIEEVSLSIREFLPAVAEPVEGGRLPKVQEATQAFVAGLADVVTVARQQEAVDTTNATYDDLDVFTDALDDLDGIIEDKLQEGYAVDEELSDYESSLIDAIDEIEGEYETISSDAETEIGYLNEITEDIADRLPAEPEDDGTETTAVSTDVKRVLDDLPEWTPSKNLIDEARREIAWLKEKWQPIYDRGNAVWGVDTEEMTEAELVAYANEVDTVRSEMIQFKWHADFMVKQVAEKGRPGIEKPLAALRDEVLKPTMDELTDLQIALQSRRNAEVERMNAMDEDGEATDEGDVTASLAGFAEAVMPADVGSNARTIALPAPLRVHARSLFAAGLDQDALNAAIAALEKDRALAPKDRAAVAEAYVGGYVNPKTPARDIRKAFAERVHDVSLAELGGFDPSVSGSNLDWRPEARAALSEMAARLPEGTGFTVRNFIEIATRSASMRKVGLEIEGGMFTPDAAERQLGMDPKSAKKIMAISLAYGPDVALQTFTHEEIHAVREFLTDKEWGVLSKLATRKPKKSEALRLIDIVETNGKVTPQHAEFLRANAGSLTYREIYGIDQRYGRLNLTEDKLVEEVVAHAAADWADGHDFGTRIERVMMKIRDLIEALGNLLKGQGFETVDSVFNSIWSGEVAKRAAAEGTQADPEAMYAIGDAETGRAMRRDLDALGYYSGALEAAKALRQAKGTPEQMLAMLRKEGAKDAEIAATGLQEFLAGKASVTKDEIVKHIEANRVRLTEARFTPDGRVPVRTETVPTGQTVDLGDGRGEQPVYRSQSVPTEAVSGETKWSAYSLDPSNPTYRETVLHLPPSETLEQYAARNGLTITPDTRNIINASRGMSNRDFQSGHFSEPNIIGHMMTSMTKHEGKPVFTVDQIQSDWGQKLRDKGVRDDAKIAALREQVTGYEQRINTIVDAEMARSAKAWEPKNFREKMFGVTGRNEIPLRTREEAKQRMLADPTTNADLAALDSDYMRLRAELRTAEASTPGNPLVNTTDQWVNTTLRRAIRQAVEANAEYIAIPSGDTVHPGDEFGMKSFYGGKDAKTGEKFEGIVPKNLRKLLTKLDRATPAPQIISTLDSPSGKTGLGKGFTLFKITDQVKESVIEDGQAMFSLAGEYGSGKGGKPTRVVKLEKGDWSGYFQHTPPAYSYAGAVARQAIDHLRNIFGLPKRYFDNRRFSDYAGYTKEEFRTQKQVINAAAADAKAEAISGGSTPFYYSMVDADGTVVGRAEGSVVGDTMYFDWFGGDRRHYGPQEIWSNSLGVGALRKIREQIRADFPEVKWFEGLRVSGARVANDSKNKTQSVFMASLAGDQNGTDVAQLNQAIDSLKTALGIQVTQNLFGVTIKAGKRKVRINPRSNILGQTSRTTGGVGVRRSRDIKAIAHEGGHSLELMLGSSLANLKAKFADALTTPFAPDLPMPKNLRPVGFSGLELDDVEQKALVEAVTTKAALMDMTKQVGALKAAPRMIGRATYDEEAYRKVENAAGAARANLIRLVGKTRADALVDEIERSTPPNVTTFVQERFSPMGAPKRRMTTAPSGEALSEAFARWFEKYTMSRESAFDMAPGFFEAFEDLLEAEAPSVLEGMHTVQEQYKAWTKRATVEDLSSDVVSVAAKNTWSDIREGKKGFSDKITGWTAEAYTGVIDDLSPVQQIVRRLLAVADRNGVKDDQGRPISLKVAENPYKIARMFRGSYATGYTWIKDGIPNHGEEKVVYPGLQKAMEAIFGQDTYDEPTYRAFGQYLISKRAIAEYDRLAAKKTRLADLENILDQGGKVLSKMNYDQGLDTAKLERRTTRHVRLDTIRRDRMNALRRAKTEERDIQERMQELRDDLAEAMRAIDDGSDVARATRDRRRRSLQMAERNARDVRNKIVDMEQEIDELNMEWTFLGNEIVNLRKATEDRAPQIAAIEDSIALLKREQDATSKRGASRPPTLEAKEWHEEFLAKVARDKKFAKFEEAAQIVYGFTQGLLTIRYQAGLIPEKLYQELSSRKGWYVPFMRDMSDAPAESVFTGGGVKSWSPFKKFDGSDRAIINPLEILSQEAYAAAQHIALNEAVGALAALAQKAGPGSANIAELMQRTEDLENNPETFTRIRDIAISMGIDEADATLMAQRMETNFANEDLQAIWSPGVKGPVAEPTLPLWQNGERKHVVLRDPEFAQDALEAMRGMGKEEMGWIAELFGKPARLLQLGVTTHPTFMPRNLVRDVFDAWIKTGALPIVTQIKGARELYRKDGEFLRQYTAAGGILGGRNIAALTSKEQQANVLDMDPRKFRLGSALLGTGALGITGAIMGGPLGGLAGATIGFAGSKNGGLLKMVEAIESMTRLGVAAHAYDRAKIHNPNLTEQEAMLEAAFVARDVFDWNRRGSKTLALVRMITFLNAQIQGLDRAARAVSGSGDRGSAVAKQMAAVFRREHDIPLSADEQRDLGEAYKTWARLGLYTALLLSLYAMYRDDDRYEDIKDGTKATHSWLPGFLGVDVRLPKAFEWAIPANFVEILWDKMEGRDPNVGERWRKSAQEVLVPPGVPQALNLLAGWSMNTDMQSVAPWLFGENADVVNRKIVSDELKKLAPEAQFDAFTSQLSKDIALAMAKAGLPEAAIPSPKMIDFTLRTGGYWGQDIQKGYQIIKESAGYPAGPQPRVPDWPVIGGFTGVAARQSKSTEMLYRLMSQQGGDFTTAAYTYKNLMDKSGNPAEAESFLNRLEPEARAYAILNYNFTAADKRRHPLERASAMAKISRDIRKEIVLDRLAPQVKEGRKTVYDFEQKIDLPPAVKTQVTEIMERLAQAESWNGFVVLGRPGWEGKAVIATKPILAELKAAAPDVYELYEGRVEKAKIQDFEEIQRDWPKMREELLRNGADANF